MKRIKIGDWVQALIYTLSFGTGEHIALWVARRLGYDKCFCCERQQWLNRLTNKEYNGRCNEIKL